MLANTTACTVRMIWGVVKKTLTYIEHFPIVYPGMSFFRYYVYSVRNVAKVIKLCFREAFINVSDDPVTILTLRSAKMTCRFVCYYSLIG